MLRNLLIAASLILAGTAAGAGFSDSLTRQEKEASGVVLLSPAQVSKLDALVAKDEDFAREGAVTGFSTSFSQRRTHQERIEAGLERLNASQRARLDSLVAFAIADPAPVIPVFQPRPAAPAASFSSPALKPEIHGDISLTVGAGKGVSFFGSGLDLNITDPMGRYSISVSLSQYRGKGFSFPDPGLPIFPGHPPIPRFPFYPGYPLDPGDLLYSGLPFHPGVTPWYGYP
jgi:hypothetical protein